MNDNIRNNPNPQPAMNAADMKSSIAEQMEQWPRLYPDRIAVKTISRQLTWDELNRQANRWARAILKTGIDVDQPIAMLISERASLTAAIIAVLKAGKFYVPLDSAFPQERINFILEDTQSPLIVTDTENISLAQQFARPGLQLFNVDEADSDVSSDNLCLPITLDALAQLTYTSGSTGNPKGVMHTHRSVLHRMQGHRKLKIGPDDRLTAVGAAGRDNFRPMLSGAGMYAWNAKEQGLSGLARWLIDEKVTIYHSVATVFRHFVDTLTGDESFPGLRLISLRGEPVYSSDLELYRKHFSDDCLLVNELGITETGSIRQFIVDKKTRISGDLVPVGYEQAEKKVLLLDDDGNEVGVNEVGEIAIKSKYISPGYWNRPDLTKEKFLDDTDGQGKTYLSGDLGRMLPDGALVHLGRKDFQVKIRGNRIEISEIEGVLRSLDNIKEAAVLARADARGHQQLVAYLVALREPAPDLALMRQAIAAKLPDYMMPSAFVVLDMLPYLPNGKMDLQSLPMPDNARPNLSNSIVEPSTPVERTLSRIWTDALNLDEIGVQDNFLELGGHSLMATRIISNVIDTFRVDVPLSAMFEAPTVQEMALLITQHQAREADPDDIEKLLGELESLSDEQVQNLGSNPMSKGPGFD